MSTIKKIPAKISGFIDLSPTARDVEITLSEQLDFKAGSFVNLFITHEGKVLRRAFSISSSDKNTDVIYLSIRKNPKGAVTPLFWNDDIVGTEVEVMGPLGLNTADKMLSSKIFLFGFGVGAGVVKSLAEHFVQQENVSLVTIMTGNRSETEILHKDWFNQLAKESQKVNVQYVVSTPAENSEYKTGYIQNNLGGLDFNNSNVYVCGQEAACEELVEVVKKTGASECTFFIEGFH